ncbi:MAG: putative toxin-antitoxin system toxin component, PIN family [Chloroflexi bacterium]|nr:putative toxin-antitoxin system toxin component, PIN family [Chloroflexota bacterium]
MARSNKVFFDANVLFSGIYGGTGAPTRLLDLCVAGTITMIVSRQVIEETVRTLRKKRPEALPSLQTLLFSLTPTVVDDPAGEEVAACLPFVRHQEDSPILAAAIKGRADFLVTGNTRHFQPPPDASIMILSPRELLDRFSR